MRLRTLTGLALSFLASAVSPAGTQAQDSNWRVSLTPYAWLMGVGGSATARGQTVDINAGVVDLFAKTDSLVALMANMEARNDRLFFGLDLVYTQMKASADFARVRNPVAGLTFSTAFDANARSTLVIAEGVVGYEVARPAEKTAVDAFLGLRYWHATTDITLGVTGAIDPAVVNALARSGSVAIASSGNMDWADPILGLQLRHEIAPHHNLRLRGDIGGFGVGSQFTWQAFAGYAWEFSPGPSSWSAALGYRALGVNYRAGSGLDARGFDVVLHGPVLGVTYRF